MTVIGHETLGSWSLGRRSARSRLLWAASLTAVVAAQLAIYLALAQVEEPPPTAGADLPTTVIELELAPDPVEGTAPPAEAVDALMPDAEAPDVPPPTTPDVVAPEAASPVEPATDAAAPIDPVTPEATELTPVETVAPPATVETAEAETAEVIPPAEDVEAEQASAVATASAETAEPVETAPPDTVLPETVTTASAEAITAVPVQTETLSPVAPRPKPKPQQQKTQQPKAQQPKPSTKPRQATVTGQQRRTPSSAQPSQASRPAASGSEISSWQARLSAKMQRAQRFPAAARRRGEFGRVQVRVSIDASGAIRSVSVAKSSGFADLDDAALDAVRRSAPLPAPPAGTPTSRLTLTVGYNFNKS